MQKEIIKIDNINKSYGNIKILDNISCRFKLGSFYAILGESGAGKSTLINLLGLIDFSYSGKYTLNNFEISKIKNKDLSDFRAKNIGFVFQDFQLLKNMTAIENVMLPMLLNKNIKKNDRYRLALNLLKKVGLEKRKDHYPRELSGGEQQRVAIARALSNNPDIILADEPTGNLDKKIENEIFKILKVISKEHKCVVVVSHSANIKHYADVIYKIKNHKIYGVKNENN